MHASETKVRQLIEGTKQYVVPLFQRPYSWGPKQWKTLWTDLLEQSQELDGRPHFFGSIVSTPTKSVPQGVGKYLLIDGQQRLTTIQILLAALRDSASRLDDGKLRERIDGQYLTNAYEADDERLKVLPTQDDRAAFRAIVWRTEIPEGGLRACYQYFLSRLAQRPADELDAIHLAIVDRLSVVSITCDEHDNPHLIFESLNAKGEKLTPADLIRNFLLMRVHVNDQDRLFRAHWLPIQQALGGELTEFVRHYLMKGGKILKEDDVYFELKDQLANSKAEVAEAFLRDLHRHGLFYAKFIGAIGDEDAEICERLDRIRRLKVTVAYPFLLRVFDARETGALGREQVMETLDILESFVLRRSICSVPTSHLRKMLPPIFDAAGGPGPGFIDGIRLQLGGKRCPDDKAFAAALSTEPLYAAGEKTARLRLILERLEHSFGHRESGDVSEAQIEHVMPQTLTPEWIEELGNGSEDEAQDLMHSLGNLTLTKYNAELSNKPYRMKRESLSSSHFELNRYFTDVARWSVDEIRQRGQLLAERSLGIWRDVGRAGATVDREREPSSVPHEVRFRDHRETVGSWKEGFVTLLKYFDRASPGLLQGIASEGSMPALIDHRRDRFPRSKVQIGEVYVNTHASAAQLQNWCAKIARVGNIDVNEYDFVVRDDGR